MQPGSITDFRHGKVLPGLIDIWEKRTYTEGWRENCRRKSRSFSRKTRGCCYAGKNRCGTFHPAGNTRKAALLLAQAMAGRTEEYDLTRPHNTGRSFGPGDVVIVAGPVYGGRLPAVMLERLAEIQGNGAFAVTLAVYGNRAYEDALIELDDSVEKQGFRRLASAALAAQHSIVTQLAAGRPDQEDAEEITRSAEEILSKYEGILSGKEQPGNYIVPGNRPYKNWNPMQAVPLVSDACIRCGLCAEKCPVEAIPREEPEKTDPAKCILCMRCVSICPEKARSLPEPLMAGLEQKLAPFRDIRGKNEWFL